VLCSDYGKCSSFAWVGFFDSFSSKRTTRRIIWDKDILLCLQGLSALIFLFLQLCKVKSYYYLALFMFLCFVAFMWPQFDIQFKLGSDSIVYLHWFLIISWLEVCLAWRKNGPTFVTTIFQLFKKKFHIHIHINCEFVRNY
jgi:hypothetical protein